ncbi:MAG: hypothetical protein JXJ20_03225 [Anaerolineae bacterium]|nr:hypothetical protein [Anaerolineae bacterium]
MTTTLRAVLHAFEHADTPLSLNQMARDLGVEPGMLESMIAHWVRKGRLREVADSPGGCAACGSKHGCPFIAKMPRRYELVTAKDPDQPFDPPCACGS